MYYGKRNSLAIFISFCGMSTLVNRRQDCSVVMHLRLKIYSIKRFRRIYYWEYFVILCNIWIDYCASKEKPDLKPVSVKGKSRIVNL